MDTAGPGGHGERVAVLLATYNGAAHLEALLHSLLAQRHRPLSIHVRDDGSSDGSVKIVRRYVGEGVTLLEDGLGRLGPARSFLELLRAARADVYMFCDQDDVWLPDKVTQAVAAIGEAGRGRPVLFHTDLRVVDESLATLAESFHRHEGVVLPDAHRWTLLLAQNCVVGCTAALSEALVEASRLREGMPAYLAMHDWWFALCASVFGTLHYSPRADILYRQHQHNVSGVSRRTLWQKARHQLTREGVWRVVDYRRRIARQAAAFAEFYSPRLTVAQAKDLEAVARLGEGSGLRGLWACRRRGIRLQRSYMNVAMAYSSLASLFVEDGTG